MNTCIAIDWLQLHVVVPSNLEQFKFPKYNIKLESYQTRHFKRVYVVTDKKTGDEIATIAAEPHSGILRELALILPLGLLVLDMRMTTLT